MSMSVSTVQSALIHFTQHLMFSASISIPTHFMVYAIIKWVFNCVHSMVQSNVAIKAEANETQNSSECVISVHQLSHIYSFAVFFPVDVYGF